MPSWAVLTMGHKKPTPKREVGSLPAAYPVPPWCSRAPSSLAARDGKNGPPAWSRPVFPVSDGWNEAGRRQNRGVARETWDLTPQSIYRTDAQRSFIKGSIEIIRKSYNHYCRGREAPHNLADADPPPS